MGEAARLDRPIVCLHDRPGAYAWFSIQVDSLGAVPVETDAVVVLDGADANRDWLDQVETALEQHAPAHLLATGAAAHGAILVAAERPDLVSSLLLGDPRTPVDTAELRALFASVEAPTLVVASMLDDAARTAPEQSQQIAGGVPNGVFVVLDGCSGPAHRERAASFDEWISLFAAIAEGLNGLSSQHTKESYV